MKTYEVTISEHEKVTVTADIIEVEDDYLKFINIEDKTGRIEDAYELVAIFNVWSYVREIP
jgi:hypothetical protein